MARRELASRVRVAARHIPDGHGRVAGGGLSSHPRDVGALGLVWRLAPDILTTQSTLVP